MKVRFIGTYATGNNLLAGKVYEARSLWGPLISIVDESGGAYYYPNDENIFEVVDPLPAPRIVPYEPVDMEEERRKYPERFTD